MYSGALRKRKRYSTNVSRSYAPLSFYMDSTVDHLAQILKGNKSSSESNCVPLSLYNTTVLYYPSLSKMDIFLSNQERTTLFCRKYHPLSFYFYKDCTVSVPRGLRVNYIPPSSTADQSKSESKVSFPCFGSQSSQSKVIKSSKSKPVDLYHSEFYLLKNRLKLNLPSPLQRSRYGSSILGSTSVKGIFCIGKQVSHQQNNSQYVLWNPLTEEFWEVPPSPAEVTPKHPVDDMYDMMDLEYIFHGFGYDQLTDDIKVIQPFNSLEVYVDGACHWLVSRWDDHLHAMTLLSFDLSDEVFITTPIGEEPISHSPYTPHQYLTVLNGSIALISNCHDDIGFHISIMGELGLSEPWIKLYIHGP
ncbi:hypothetical protein TSUD_376220 [Trifolium subterraneum]|uniref:F-box associated domain-containing protein n=1 Tax=Trifolium subterraneum TaxID=3900 RepID=A0A2Z6M745_TRISU|nr:hypothetical protein TSUD_376220 [Trifolium subterraneum]